MRLILLTFIIFSITTLQAAPITLQSAAQKSYPKYFLNETNIEGLCIEIIEAIQKADPDIHFINLGKPKPLARIVNGLKENRIDAFVGLSRSKKRDQSMNFSLPAYELHRVVAVRQNDNIQVNSYADIKALKDDNSIMSLHGSNNLAVLKQHGLNITGNPSSVGQGLLMLIKHRGRFFSYHDLGIIGTIKKNKLENKVRILPAYLETFEQHIAYSKKVPKKVIDRVDTAIKTIQKNGEIQKILDRYFRL